MKEILYEVGSSILVGVIMIGILLSVGYFFPNFIDTISYYLTERIQRY